MQGFVNALEEFRKRKVTARLKTGSGGLDYLFGGGLEPGLFYLFYGDDGSVDPLIQGLLASSLQHLVDEDCETKAIYLNCGNYREEKTILDTQLLCSMIERFGMDPLRELDRVHVFCAFSDEQQEDVVEKAQTFLEDNPEVRLVVVHNIAKLFTRRHGGLTERLERIQRLQNVISKLWQTAAQRDVVLVASCRPIFSLRSKIPEPEGGRYLRHLASAITYLRRVKKNQPFFSAHLLKHPGLEPRKTDYTLDLGGENMGRITTPFNIVLREEINRLKENYQKALKEPSRREALNSLLQVWSSERGAMNNAEVPTALDVMLLTAVVDNRRLIQDLFSRMDALQSGLKEIRRRLDEGSK